ncbi:MAG: LuxR C-terminal-related transcriptional regulator [Solirubrobacteraceae bacterium]
MEDEQLDVIVVDDHLIMRSGLQLLLGDAGLRVAGVAGNAEEARSLLSTRHFDVALIDVHLGQESAADLVEHVIAERPGAAIVLYVGVIRYEPLRRAMRAGAGGSVLKLSPASHLIDALRTVAAGDTYLDPRLEAIMHGPGELQRFGALSPRELEILGLLADGLTGSLIAQRLVLSPETVRTHVRNATYKLGARSRVQAVAMLVQAGQHQ